MKKSRLHGALRDSRGSIGPTLSSISNNNSTDDCDEDLKSCGTRPETTTRCVGQLGTSSAPDHPHRRVQQCTTDTLVVSGSCTTAEQMPIAIQSMRRIVADMHAAAGNIHSDQQLLGAIASDLNGYPTLNQIPDTHPSSQERTVLSTWYKVESVVGRGTYGSIYRGTHRLNGARVAIKSYVRHKASKVCRQGDGIQPHHSDDPLDWKRACHEARMMAKLPQHPNIIYYFETFESATRLDLVMEMVDGADLCELLRHQPGRRLPENRARHVIAAVCSAVASLHARNIIHRDLKLENVLINEADSRPVLVDFGFSELEVHPTAFSTPRTKNFCGTPPYMAPEIISSQQYDGKAADVWSLGVILYLLLCGKFPFQSTSLHQLFQSARNSQRLAVPSSVSSAAQALIRSILIPDPGRRPAAHQILLHPWFVASPNPAYSPMTALQQWDGARAMVCEALAALYDVDQTELLAALGERKRTHLTAFIRVAVATASRVFAAEMKRQLSASQAMDSGDDRDEDTKPVNARHTQVVGLAKYPHGS